MASSSNCAFPLVLRPILVPRVWGGERIPREIHPDAEGTPGPIGESWEVSDVGDDPALHSVVAAGPLAGRTLRELLREDPAGMLGSTAAAAAPPPSLPLLFKFIDARAPLSVQLHPSDEDLARAGLAGIGKNEAWVILDADDGAFVIHGFEPGWDLERYLAAARAGAGAAGLRRVPVHRGDVVHVPPGTVHAIGAGVLLAEVQQSSDITYRIHDWDRAGLDGRPRALHLEEASRVTPPVTLPPCPLKPPGRSGPLSRRLETEHFVLEEIRVDDGPIALPPTAGRCAILAVLEGRGRLLDGSAAGLPLDSYSVLFFPAGCPRREIRASEPFWALWATPPALTNAREGQ